MEIKDQVILIDQTTSHLNNGRDNKSGGTLSRAEEFESFKRGKGLEMNQILAENKGN
jgi:hypothetical protein